MRIVNIAALKKELELTDKLLNERQKLLDAIPECEAHGSCVPHALEWIENMKTLKQKILELQQYYLGGDCESWCWMKEKDKYHNPKTEELYIELSDIEKLLNEPT